MTVLGLNQASGWPAAATPTQTTAWSSAAGMIRQVHFAAEIMFAANGMICMREHGLEAVYAQCWDGCCGKVISAIEGGLPYY